MNLTLPKPVSPFIVSQNFAENSACIYPDNRVVGLVGLNCPLGSVELYKKFGMAGHNGLDLAANRGVPIFSSTEGVVNEISTEPERGLGVGVVTQQKYQFKSLDGGTDYGEHYAKLRYWHMLSISVKLGQVVQKGSLLGFVDNTGFSSGDHCHWELKPVEYSSQGVMYNVYQNNGFYGAVDPTLFLTGLTAFEFNDFLAKIRIQIAILVAILAIQVAEYIAKHK